jgi:hypothetical protein
MIKKILTMPALTSLILLILGAGIGASLMFNMLPIADNCNIIYVAQDEIMALEQARVENEQLADQQLFYGEIEQAVKLATALPKQYQNRTTKLVYSMNSVSGDNVKSISKEIHQAIIARLKEQKKE